MSKGGEIQKEDSFTLSVSQIELLEGGGIRGMGEKHDAY